MAPAPRSPRAAQGPILGWSRRDFLASATSVLALPACLSSIAQPIDPTLVRLTARPGLRTGTLPLEMSALGLGAGRDGAMYVPTSYRPDEPIGLMLFLHGSGLDGATYVRGLQTVAEAEHYIMLSPDSRGPSWDYQGETFVHDPPFVNAAMAHVYGRATIDSARTSIGGHSAGGAYALSLGLANGDIFPKVFALAPAALVQAEPVGKPAILIMHGRHDMDLPIDITGRRFAAQLATQGYRVDFREFDGGHNPSGEVARVALEWAAQ